MCLSHFNITGIDKWKWDGDAIVQNPIIPSIKSISGSKSKYDLDIRQFLVISDNAVIRRVLNEISSKLKQTELSIFHSRLPGSFDFRVKIVLDYISKNISYKLNDNKNLDEWQFPEETITLKSGDCEDRAFLLASLMIASGISNYSVRIALGKLYNCVTKQSQDHVWVMYKNESGLWMLLEPMIFTPEQNKKHLNVKKTKEESTQDTFEYIPYFLFNADHCWASANNSSYRSFIEYFEDRTFWNNFTPAFATSIHNSIFDEAFNEMPYLDLNYVKAFSLTIDSIQSYDPRDHFDNGYVNESWSLAIKRLEQKSISGLAYAGHAISDFYAHTTYAHFAKINGNGLVLFNGTITPDIFATLPDYGSGQFDLNDASKFSTNAKYCSKISKADIKKLNTKMIISGRFAQPGDPYQSFLEKYFVNIPYELKNSKDFPWRGCLPHHNEIAVDGPLLNNKIPDGHKLYSQSQVYQNQYDLRKNAAVRHLKELYIQWKR